MTPKRCSIFVPARSYSAPGQCRKTNGLKKIKVGVEDLPVLVCPHHAAVIQGQGTRPARGMAR